MIIRKMTLIIIIIIIIIILTIVTIIETFIIQIAVHSQVV